MDVQTKMSTEKGRPQRTNIWFSSTDGRGWAALRPPRLHFFISSATSTL